MNARSRTGKRGPTSASIPSANAVSVDMATPQPCAESWPAFSTRKIETGTIIPPRPAASGRASRRRSRSSPMSNSRRASRPTTKKKSVISPLFSQYCTSCESPHGPTWMEIVVCTNR
jgi:hypothetical protein